MKTLKNIPQTILISAYPEHSLDAFEVGVTDYLQKPFGFDRFLKAVGRAIEMIQLRSKTHVVEKMQEMLVFLKSGRDSLKFDLNDIIYVEALASFSKVFITNRSEERRVGKEC